MTEITCHTMLCEATFCGATLYNNTETVEAAQQCSWNSTWKTTIYAQVLLLD